MRIRVLLFTALLGVGAPCVALAQVPGSLLREGELEAGVTVHKFDRPLEYGNQKSVYDGTQWAATFRLGVTESMTASVELSAGAPIYEDDDRVYLVGASIQTRMWSHERTRATTSIGYGLCLVMQRANTDGDDYRRQTIDWNAQIEHTMDIERQEVTVWAGPALSFMGVIPQAPEAENLSESTQLIGGLAGASVVIARHVVVGMQGTWIEELEYLLQLAYRF